MVIVKWAIGPRFFRRDAIGKLTSNDLTERIIQNLDKNDSIELDIDYENYITLAS